jgi:peroxiredoxin
VVKRLYLLVLVGWGALLCISHLWQAGPAVSQPTVSAQPAERHYVTPKQLAASGAWQDQHVAPFAAQTHEGRWFDSREVVGECPTVLVFIKRDCPCSVEFEPFFHRLEGRYRGLVRFLGVMDGDPDVARRYAAANRVPYPVLADPERSIVKVFKAENGGYVVLLKPTGEVAMLWPGCSAEMMRELNREVAHLAGVSERPVEVAGMPAVLTTGCPFTP